MDSQVVQTLGGLLWRVLLVPIVIYMAAISVHGALVPPYKLFVPPTPTTPPAIVTNCPAVILKVPVASSVAIDGKCERTPDDSEIKKAKEATDKANAEKERNELQEGIRRTKLGQVLVVAAGFASIIGFIGVSLWARQQIALRAQFGNARTVTHIGLTATCVAIVIAAVELIGPTVIAGWVHGNGAPSTISEQFAASIKTPFRIETATVYAIARAMDALSLFFTLIVAFCATLPLDPDSHDQQKDVHWAREFTTLRECLYVGAGILVLRIVWMSVLMMWPFEVMTSDKETFRAYVHGTLAFWGITFTAMLLGTYGVATQILGQQARRYYKLRNAAAAQRLAQAKADIEKDAWRSTWPAAQRAAEVEGRAKSLGLMAVPDADIEKVLKDGGANIGEHIAKFIAILAPLAAGPIASTITGLLK